jgi:membrane protein DedA with SNARE-associated domain
MHLLAAATPPSALGIGAYLALFVAAAAGYMGIPFIGTAVIGLAAVLASQGRLNIVAVLAVAAVGCEVGGLGGYGIGGRWGRQLLEHPGPGLAWRKKAITKGEDVLPEMGTHSRLRDARHRFGCPSDEVPPVRGLELSGWHGVRRGGRFGCLRCRPGVYRSS